MEGYGKIHLKTHRMDSTDSTRGKRIAKNTLMLYVRMLVLLLIGLFTSRVVLAALGENDFGVYNVIGGVVSMFAIISGTMNAAVSRFITFELGKGSAAQTGKVYSTAVVIQLVIALIIVAAAEPAGLWFIENRMSIAPERIPAAKWVLHFSLFAFAVNIMSVPQMAMITAHEKMSAYAVIGLMDGFLRLGVAVAVMHSGFDRLILYAALMALAVTLVRLAYAIYCRRNFADCRFRPIWDKALLREMFSFAGWNIIGVTSGVLRDHGGNLLINIFFNPAVNAARGIAIQLNGAVQGFVTNFMTAVNPQITKSYASGEREYMFSLVRKASRMSFYLMLILALPLLFNTEYFLDLWLKDVPGHAVAFVQLILLLTLSECISTPMMTAQLATGKIRDYQIVVGGLIMLNLPISYICLKLGAPAECTVAVAIVIAHICYFARVIMLKRMINLSVRSMLRVYVNVILTGTAACGAAWLLPDMHPLANAALCVLASLLAVAFVGLSAAERKEVFAMLKNRFI